MCHQCNKGCNSSSTHELKHRVERLEEQIELLTSIFEEWIEEESEGEELEWESRKCPCSCTDCICH
jgi:hypothetical protein